MPSIRLLKMRQCLSFTANFTFSYWIDWCWSWGCRSSDWSCHWSCGRIVPRLLHFLHSPKQNAI